MALGPFILSQVADVYRKIRFTLRYILGNLYDFNPEQDAVPYEQLPATDRFILYQFIALLDDVASSYEAFQFYRVYQVCTCNPAQYFGCPPPWCGFLLLGLPVLPPSSGLQLYFNPVLWPSRKTAGQKRRRWRRRREDICEKEDDEVEVNFGEKSKTSKRRVRQVREATASKSERN
jgi:hypothetical protein